MNKTSRKKQKHIFEKQSGTLDWLSFDRGTLGQKLEISPWNAQSIKLWLSFNQALMGLVVYG